MASLEIFNTIISTIDSNTRKPEQFLSVQNKVALDLKNSTKRLYDFTKEQSQRNTRALPELVTEGFDEEQIWQQLELQNEGELMHFLTRVSKVLTGNQKLIVPISPTKPDPVVSENKSDHENEERVLNIKESQKDEKKVRSSLKEKNDKKRKMKPSIVDDKFFKLQELDEYLTKEERKQKQSNKNEESDEESVDLFNAFCENENDENEEGKILKYADFFDSPQSEDENLNETRDSVQCKSDNNDESDNEDSVYESEMDDTMDSENDETKDKPSIKRVKFNLTNDSDETDSLENKVNTSANTDPDIKSSFESRQERLQKRIQELEGKAVSEKPWQLKGEVSATNRPQNSLLEEYVEFDITTRPAPVITEQTTLKLEDIIKQRIKDKAWDDVEKKFKPVETPLEYKKKLILDQEKSKESLSQIYENEYLKQKQALNPENNEREEEEPQLHKEIREMMHSVFSKLDALSNFHYTPKPAKPDIKIISNVPAINMEEVAPVATSDATLLAPQEVKAKPRGDVIGKAERTETDMKRERRRKKIRQREKQTAVEQKEKLNALKPGINKKYNKNKATALLKKLSKDQNVAQMIETSHKVTKSSTAFFTQLQDQVQSHIKSKTDVVSKKKSKNTLSAVKLKL